MKVIADRVTSIDPADPDRPRKAFRVFLEVVLLAELGEPLINDPGFYGLVDKVHREMEMDSELLMAIEIAGRSLVNGQHQP